MDLSTGATLAGRYEIRAVISRRPTGLLYHGYDRQIGVEVALRVIDEELLVSDEERRAFVQRAGRARSLQHPNLMRLYDVLVDDAAVFLIMQWAPGDRLSRMLEISPMPLPQLRTLVRRAAAGIAHAHQQGVVLGNLRPDTVMLYADGLKLTNVGIGPALPRARFLSVMRRLGRLDELAPEIVAGKEPDERCDLYALARLTHNLLSRLPERESLLSLAEPVLERALFEDPAGRPRGVETFVRELENALDGRATSRDTVVSAPPVPTGKDTERVEKLEGLAAARESTDPEAKEPALDLERGPDEGPTQLRGPTVKEVSQLLELGADELVEVSVEGFSGEGVTVPVPRHENGIGALVDVTDVGHRKPVRADTPEPPVEPAPAPLEPELVAPEPSPRVESTPDLDLEVTNLVPRSRYEPKPVATAAPAPVVPAPVAASAPPPVVPAPVAAPVPAPPPIEPSPPRAPEPIVAESPAEAIVTPPRDADLVRAEQHGRALLLLVVFGMSLGVFGAAALWKMANSSSRPTVAVVPPTPAPTPAATPAPQPIVAPQPITTPAPPPTAQPIATPTPAPKPISTPIPSVPTAAAPDAGPCPLGMALLSAPHRACVDQYEYPGGHTIPRTKISLADASEVCRSRGLRLCTDGEWEAACRGPGNASYPYGSSYDPARCNTGGKATHGEVLPGGAMARCRSAKGAYDMSGNVAEWTASGNQRGGSAFTAQPTPRCSHVVRNADPQGAADVGFRCCSDAR